MPPPLLNVSASANHQVRKSDRLSFAYYIEQAIAVAGQSISVAVLACDGQG